MEFSAILDIIFALGGVYLLLSLISTAFLEMWAGNRRMRTRFLNKAIDGMLAGAAADFYEHPLIKSLVEKSNTKEKDPIKQKPAYIPSDIFASALLATVAKKFVPKASAGAAADPALDDLRVEVGKLPYPLLRVLARHQLDEQAVLSVPRLDRRPLLAPRQQRLPRVHAEPAALLVAQVTLEAPLGQNRMDVAREGNRPRAAGDRRRSLLRLPPCARERAE